MRLFQYLTRQNSENSLICDPLLPMQSKEAGFQPALAVSELWIYGLQAFWRD